MATNGTNGNSTSMTVLVGAVLASVFMLLGFMLILIIWGGVKADTVLPIFVPGVMVALAFLWKSFQDREVARQIKEARADIKANTEKVDTVVQTAGVLTSDVGDLKKAVDGMTTKLVIAEVGKERAEGETKAAVLALGTAQDLAEANAAPSNLLPPPPQEVIVVNSEPVAVDVITPVVPVEVVDKKN